MDTKLIKVERHGKMVKLQQHDVGPVNFYEVRKSIWYPDLVLKAHGFYFKQPEYYMPSNWEMP